MQKPQPIMHKKQAKKSQQFLCVEFDELSENIHLPVRSGTHSPNAKEELPSHPNAVRELGVSEILWPCIRPVPPEDCDVGVLCCSCGLSWLGHTQCCNPAFLSLSPADSWGWIILCCGGLSCPLWDAEPHPWPAQQVPAAASLSAFPYTA